MKGALEALKLIKQRTIFELFRHKMKTTCLCGFPVVSASETEKAPVYCEVVPPWSGVLCTEHLMERFPNRMSPHQTFLS